MKDAELPPIMEEEEAEIGVVEEAKAVENEDLELLSAPPIPNNEEKAIVLFKHVNAPFLQHSPSNLSFSVDSHIISGFKKSKSTFPKPKPPFIFIFYQNNK